MGVETVMMDPLPPTEYTKGIPGGTGVFWGMAFNKLHVFNLTRFRKLVWIDADDYFVANVDHLLGMPPLSGSMVTACINQNGPAYAGGGIWVLEPSVALFASIMDVISKPRPGTNEGWMLGDMQVVRHMFGDAPPPGADEPLYPAINDGRHGYVGGLRYFSKYRGMTPAEFDAAMDARLDRRKPRIEGYDESKAVAGEIHWRALDMRYDQCVGNFPPSPERDEPEVMFSVHFSCLQFIGKPSHYVSERALFDALYNFGDDHYRYWYLRWYATYSSAVPGGYHAPKWRGPPVPGRNATHSAIVAANKLAGGRDSPLRMYEDRD